jgi:large subunit ribosomal protein L24
MSERQKLHVKSGDNVMVISGKDKGKNGRVLAAYPKTGRILVEGVNMVKKHTRPNAANPQGGIVTQEGAIHSSNVMIVDPKTGEPTRIGHKIVDGKKVRIAKKSGEILDK